MQVQRALQGPFQVPFPSQSSGHPVTLAPRKAVHNAPLHPPLPHPAAVSCRLATHVIKSVRNFSQAELRSVLAVYRDVCPRRHSLVPTLALMEDELAPYVSPSPQ